MEQNTQLAFDAYLSLSAAKARAYRTGDVQTVLIHSVQIGHISPNGHFEPSYHGANVDITA